MAFSIVYGNALEYDGDAVLNSLGIDGAKYGKLCRNIIKGINRDEVKNEIDSLRNMPIGKIIETEGGDLKCAHVLHVVTPFKKQDNDNCDELRKAYKSVIDLAVERGYKTIGLPFIGTGANGYTDGEVYDVLTDLLSEISDEEEKRGEKIIDATIIAYLRRTRREDRPLETPPHVEFIGCEYEEYDLYRKDERTPKKQKGDKKNADIICDIVEFMADIDPDEMFYPNYPSGRGYDRHFEFVEDYCKQYGINKKRALKEYDCRKRQKVAAQYTLSKLDVYRFTVLLKLNKSEFVTFMTICGHMPDPNSKLDMFFINYMGGMYGNVYEQHTLFDMDKLFGLQDGIQFTISGTESAAQAIKYCSKK